MNRREAISSVALLLGGTVLGAEIFTLTGCTSSPKQINDLFNSNDVLLLDEIAETIIPETDTPGAKATKAGEFMALMVKDCYDKEHQKVFLDGLKNVDDEAKKQYKADFLSLDKDQKKALLTHLDKQQKAYQETKEKEAPPHYFRMMKELTLLGYFTSEIGGSQALTYVEVPGRYDACIPYKKGDPVFLTP
ncbi:gluconate 2-dehydrogenase subunit 3 family protein [Pedobacter aquae]|uniref:Gluconate 2-dehydrogenase subunit 3 family protein n=1 Tax=Pedobacter aquae TaxID=2605747 RepID=A0A5C0VIE9_9SPHI|nr:gluconate 2-dehydrogenase subunit 3 family protein [Pedobacter aquae]QEK52276.1 gluconate 2-dehydrogenase subunit 3 family protein [Pedobacter aquae]